MMDYISSYLLVAILFFFLGYEWRGEKGKKL